MSIMVNAMPNTADLRPISTIGGTLACGRRPAGKLVCEIFPRHCVLFRQRTNNEPYVAAFVMLPAARRSTYSCCGEAANGRMDASLVTPPATTDVWRIIKSDEEGRRDASPAPFSVKRSSWRNINSSCITVDSSAKMALYLLYRHDSHETRTGW